MQLIWKLENVNFELTATVDSKYTCLPVQEFWASFPGRYTNTNKFIFITVRKMKKKKPVQLKTCGSDGQLKFKTKIFCIFNLHTYFHTRIYSVSWLKYAYSSIYLWLKYGKICRSTAAPIDITSRRSLGDSHIDGLMVEYSIVTTNTNSKYNHSNSKQ